MAVYSMTGYASAQSDLLKVGDLSQESQNLSGTSGNRVGVEIRAVNSRFLDLNFKLPEECRQIEPQLRELVQKQLKRGKVELRVWLESDKKQSLKLPAESVLQSLAQMEEQLLSFFPQANRLSIADLLSYSDASESSNINYTMTVIELVQEVLKALKLARAQEGARLSQMLHDRCVQIRHWVGTAQPLVAQVVQTQGDRFLERWKEAMALTGADASTIEANTLIHERALAEATAFAIRVDIDEELTRLNSHIDEILQLLEKGGELGKRLDFLIQELLREANTLGSKAASFELTKIAVELKVLIEQMREQVQNLE